MKCKIMVQFCHLCTLLFFLHYNVNRLRHVTNMEAAKLTDLNIRNEYKDKREL